MGVGQKNFSFNKNYENYNESELNQVDIYQWIIEKMKKSMKSINSQWNYLNI